MKLLTPKQVATMLGISTAYAYKLAERNLLPSVRFGIVSENSGRKKLTLRFKESDVQNFIDKNYNGKTT